MYFMRYWNSNTQANLVNKTVLLKTALRDNYLMIGKGAQ